MSYLTSFELALVTHFFVFAVTLLFAQKIKDWISGIPADVRTSLKTVEKSTVGNVIAARTAVLARLTTSVPAPPAPPAPVAPVAPVVPAAPTV